MIKSFCKSVMPYPLRQRLRNWQGRFSKGMNPLAKYDPLVGYEFVNSGPIGEPWRPGMADRRTINWVIPDMGVGGGGHLNIFRFARNLEQMGWVNRIIIPHGSQHRTSRQAEQFIRDHYFPLDARVTIGCEDIPPATITMATEWRTAYVARDFQSTAHRCYFVQDFEPYFFAPSSDYALAEATYSFGFTGITAGNWLARKLHAEYGMTTHPVGFSYDRELYTPTPNRERSSRVFFYARQHTQRRGFELGLLVLREVARQHPDLKVILAGQDLSQFSLPFRNENHGIVPLNKLAGLYNRCDAALVLSFTNLSLLPLELMACGCPVVSNTGPNVEWLLNETNAILAEPTVEALSESLLNLLRHPERGADLSRRGLECAAATDWVVEGKKVASILEGLCDQ